MKINVIMVYWNVNQTYCGPIVDDNVCENYILTIIDNNQYIVIFCWFLLNMIMHAKIWFKHTGMTINVHAVVLWLVWQKLTSINFMVILCFKIWFKWHSVDWNDNQCSCGGFAVSLTKIDNNRFYSHILLICVQYVNVF